MLLLVFAGPIRANLGVHAEGARVKAWAWHYPMNLTRRKSSQLWAGEEGEQHFIICQRCNEPGSENTLLLTLKDSTILIKIHGIYWNFAMIRIFQEKATIQINRRISVRYETILVKIV